VKMMPASIDAHAASLRALRRFLRPRESAQAAEEFCQMCSAPLVSAHRHLLDLARHDVLCACDACALLFANAASGQGKYRLIPRRILALRDFQMSDEQWNELMLPVNLLYLFRSTEAGRMVAFYPSPAGAMESLLDQENWETLLRTNPVLNDLESEVEALLINRMEQTRAYYLVPIDACYRLVGLLRVSWRGLSGGQEVWERVTDFFAQLQAQATPVCAQDDPARQFGHVVEVRHGEGEDNGCTGSEL